MTEQAGIATLHSKTVENSEVYIANKHAVFMLNLKQDGRCCLKSPVATDLNKNENEKDEKYFDVRGADGQKILLYLLEFLNNKR